MDYKKKLDEQFAYAGETGETGVTNIHDALDVIESGVDSQTEITLEREFQARCPTDGHTDEYLLTVTYYPARGRVLEIESFSDWVAEFEGTEAPQEAWCHFICHALWAFLKPDELDVIVEGEHYGVQTTVRKQRIDE